MNHKSIDLKWYETIPERVKAIQYDGSEECKQRIKSICDSLRKQYFDDISFRIKSLTGIHILQKDGWFVVMNGTYVRVMSDEMFRAEYKEV